MPLIIRGPGIKPGMCCRVRTVGVDLFPTIAELARVTEPPPSGSGRRQSRAAADQAAAAAPCSVRARTTSCIFRTTTRIRLGPASAILWATSS